MGASGRVVIAGLPEVMAFESNPEEWEVKAILKPGETIPRRREEKVQSLKNRENLGLVKKQKGAQRHWNLTNH